MAAARVPQRYYHCTFDDFVTYDNDTLEDALSRSRQMAKQFPVIERGLFFLGEPGVGKTHLAVAILKQVILTRGARGIFYDTRDLLKLIRGTYNDTNKTTELDVLRLQEQRLRERQAAEASTARQALDSMEQQVAKEQARLALLRERAQLLDKSFRAGETPLPDLLRAVASAAQAEGALARQLSAVGAARARLNQALGVTP